MMMLLLLGGLLLFSYSFQNVPEEFTLVPRPSMDGLGRCTGFEAICTQFSANLRAMFDFSWGIHFFSFVLSQSGNLHRNWTIERLYLLQSNVLRWNSHVLRVLDFFRGF
jgi:hypothetical protein